MAKSHRDRRRRFGWKKIIGSHCIYCGERPSTEDHFPPISYGVKGWIFPACGECNSVAGSEFPADLGKRIRFVNSRIRKRYAKELSLPEWSEEEIETLGYNLAMIINAAVGKQKIAQDRIRWDGESYVAGLLEDYGPGDEILED